MCIVYDTISKYNNYYKKFPVTKSAFLARGWEWRGIGTDCPEMGGFNFLYRSGQLII